MKNDATGRGRESYEDLVPRLDAGGGGFDWNNPITRRRFLKRTGGATAATMLALHGMRVEVLAAGTPTVTVTKYERETSSGWIVFSAGDSVEAGGKVRITYKVSGSGGSVWLKGECGANAFPPPSQSDPIEVSPTTTGTIVVEVPVNVTGGDRAAWLKLKESSTETGTYTTVAELTGIYIWGPSN